MASTYRDIINAATDDEHIRDLLRLDMNATLNSVPGERPSTAARMVVRSYQNDPDGYPAKFRAARQNDSRYTSGRRHETRPYGAA